MATLKRSSLVWAVDHSTDPSKVRPAVVLDIRGDQVIVCFGSSTQRDGTYEIDHRCRVGMYFGLRNPTYFGPRARSVDAAADISRVCKGFAEPKIMEALEDVLF